MDQKWHKFKMDNSYYLLDQFRMAALKVMFFLLQNDLQIDYRLTVRYNFFVFQNRHLFF